MSRRRLALVGLAIVALIAGLSVAIAADDDTARPYAIFLGDSYTEGASEGGNGSKNYAAVLSARMGWDHKRDGIGGTGYAVAPTYGDRVDAIVEDKPDVVVALGSLNDSNAGAVRTEAAKALRRLRDGLPRARLIVVGAPWVNGNPPPTLRAVNDAVRDAAQATPRTVFIDPVRGRWFAGPDDRLIGEDGVHPTDEGHAYMADKIFNALRRAGVRPATS